MIKEKYKVGQIVRLNKMSHREGTVVQILRAIEGSTGQICDVVVKDTGEFIGSYHANRIEPLPTPEVGDTVEILTGLFTGFTAEVLGGTPDSYKVKLLDEGKNATLHFDGQRLNVTRKARTVGKTIKPQHVRIGDTIESTLIKGDATFTRKWIVGTIDRQAVGLHHRIGTKRDILLWDRMWTTSHITLLEEGDIDEEDFFYKLVAAPAGQVVTGDGGLVARKIRETRTSSWEAMVKGNFHTMTVECLNKKLVNPKFMKEEK